MSQKFLTRRAIFAVMLGMMITCLVALSGCAEGNRASSQTTPTVVKMDASWHIHYSDVKSAKQDPDLNLIISATTRSLRPTQSINGVVTTDVVFNITHVAWNPQKLPVSSTIIVRTLGGTIGNKLYEVDDFPMFKMGEQEILFLHFDSTTGIAGTLGGPSGRLLVQNGQVKPLNSEGMNMPANTSANLFLTSIPSA